jgi:hypothetical protein
MSVEDWHRHHEVSILTFGETGERRYFGCCPRKKVSMMRMRPPPRPPDNADQEPDCDVPQPDAASSADDLAGDPGIADLTRKIAANPNDAVSHYKRGQVYASKRAYALAMQDFDAVVRLAPKDAKALNNRCWTRAITGDLQGALSDCNLALQIDPGLTDALDSRGLVNLKLGRFAEAIKDYTKAVLQVLAVTVGRSLGKHPTNFRVTKLWTLNLLGLFCAKHCSKVGFGWGAAPLCAMAQIFFCGGPEAPASNRWPIPGPTPQRPMAG